MMGRTVTLTAGNDRFIQGLAANNIQVTVLGLAGVDAITLNRVDDLGGGNTVNAGAGNDTVLNRLEGANAITMGAGNDTYVGLGFGSFTTDVGDRVLGGPGNDSFAFSTFTSTYLGGNDNDTFFSVGWQNTINGGAGNDTVSYRPRADDATQGDTGVTINLATQRVATGGARVEVLVSIENAEGSAHGDRITGNGQANRLAGAGGLDALLGGAGADRFVYLRTSDAVVRATVAEEIGDFSRAQGDRIDLHGMDANRNAAGNQDFTFRGAAAFNGHAGQVRFATDGVNTIVQGDTSGDGVADFQILLDDVTTLRVGDFIL
jgi:serralysin